MYFSDIPQRSLLSLAPLIEVHTAVDTILGKLSSFKRASRSLAKTGFCLSSFSFIFSSWFSKWFFGGSWRLLGVVLGAFGTSFGYLFGNFLVFWGIQSEKGGHAIRSSGLERIACGASS